MKLISFWFVILVVLFSIDDREKEVEKNISSVLIDTEMNNDINRIEPPNWWIGFKNKKLQLLVHHPNIGKSTANIDYRGVSIEGQHQAKSPNYLFLDLIISEETKPGPFNIEFNFEDETVLNHSYELKAKEKASSEFIGFNSSDVIYLITPDRFANGDPSNDIIPGLKEARIDRQDDYARHGGDIKGIANHLGYIEDMGFTALWSTPLLMNDMPQTSYHGYAITDYYKVDPRFGTLEEYVKLSQEAKKRGIKLIMDMVANHCGNEHWWMKDLPFNDWINGQQALENGEAIPTSNHLRTTNQDLYASEYDSNAMTAGWFVPSMPDLNQSNPFLAKYIIQNSIWWIETLGLGGIRQDTYPYPEKDFMSDWAGAIMKEYPSFNIVGEEWSYNPLIVGYWQDGQTNADGYKSNLRSSMDFPMQQAIVNALNEDETWNTGLIKIYEGLANDFYYPRPMDMMIFADNHDMDRIFTQLKEDVQKTKMALALILTFPRTPQIYYGTEILLQNSAKPGDHGLIRTDFPGGWEGDIVNAFEDKGLNGDQIDFKNFLKTILNFRKQSKALQLGKTTHFAPFDGVYALFRDFEEEAVLILLNKNEDNVEVDLKRFEELNLQECQEWKDVLTKSDIQLQNKLSLKPGVTIISNNF